MDIMLIIALATLFFSAGQFILGIIDFISRR